ncbi:MAG: hypothetical protein ABI903_06705 [Actinomycetota bacterium]
MAAWAAVQAGHSRVSWHFFTTGAALLSSDDPGAGLHLYATHPQLQIGPLTFLAATPLNGLPAWLSGAMAVTGIAATGPAMLLSLSRLPQVSMTNRQRGLAAAVLMPVWAELAVHYTHLDDALALVLLLGGMHAVARSRPIPAALLLAASAGAKPWALAFVPLLMVLPRDRWRRALLVWLPAVAAAWLPFVLADPRTLHAGGFSIPNVASSSLRVLGVTAASTPSWDRPVQLLVGVVLGVVAVRRGRWLVVPAVVLAVRMLLDPGAYPYYTSGLVLTTILVDVGWRRTRWPWVSLGVVCGLYVARCLGPLTPTNAQLGWLRAATLLGVLVIALGPELRLGSDTGPGDRDRAGPRDARRAHHHSETVMIRNSQNGPTSGDSSVALIPVIRRSARSATHKPAGRRRLRGVPHAARHRPCLRSVRYLPPGGAVASHIKSGWVSL